jgi:uncharacterized protein (DUF983 family)
MSSPWDALEPEPEPQPETGTEPETASDATTAPPPDRPSHRRRDVGTLAVFARGAARRCPRCGSGGLFASWFTIRDRCPRCGLRLEREEGGFLGAITINYAFTALVWIVLLVVWLVVDLPDLHVAALSVASIAVAALVPLLFWPSSKTIWAAIDFLIYRTSPDYGSREAADRSTGDGAQT